MKTKKLLPSLLVLCAVLLAAAFFLRQGQSNPADSVEEAFLKEYFTVNKDNRFTKLDQASEDFLAKEKPNTDASASAAPSLVQMEPGSDLDKATRAYYQPFRQWVEDSVYEHMIPNRKPLDLDHYFAKLQVTPTIEKIQKLPQSKGDTSIYEVTLAYQKDSAEKKLRQKVELIFNLESKKIKSIRVYRAEESSP